MKPFLLLMNRQARWLWLGLLMSLICLIASMSLFGLSGGFLAATALAGVSVASAQAFNFFLPAAGVRFFAIARTATRWAERVLTHEATFRIIGEIRVWLYARLIRLSPRQLQAYHGGDLLNRLTQDIDALNNLYQRLLLPSIAGLISFALLGLVLMLRQATLFWPWLLLLLASFLILPWLAWQMGKQPAQAQVLAISRVRRDLLDAIDGLEDFSLHQPAWQQQRATIIEQDAARIALQMRLQRLGAALRALQFLAVGLAAWAVLGMAASEPTPWLAALVLLTLGSLEAVQALPQAWLELPGTVASAARLSALSEQTPDPAFVTSGPTPTTFPMHLQAVSFAYDPLLPILQDATLVIPQGCHLALVGPSGGGKTTLMQLIARLIDPQAGRITLGGLDLRELDESTLRSHIACAPQEGWMFTAPLADNLRLARPDACEDELWQVLDVVGLKTMVETWPDGLQTWIEEGGASLSGGQRRRLGLARALLAHAPITLLDEPTEGLDPASEIALIARIRQQLAGRTLIWVSHRSHGNRAFDQIWRIENGVLMAETETAH
jgi:ATP-binding cassette, subfamily C, bacterial CydC